MSWNRLACMLCFRRNCSVIEWKVRVFQMIYQRASFFKFPRAAWSDWTVFHRLETFKSLASSYWNLKLQWTVELGEKADTLFSETIIQDLNEDSHKLKLRKFMKKLSITLVVIEIKRNEWSKFFETVKIFRFDRINIRVVNYDWNFN